MHPLLHCGRAILGRLLLSLIFLLSGFRKLTDFSGTIGYMKPNVPFENETLLSALLVIAIVLELAGGLMLASGWKAKWGAGLLILFLIPTTLLMHDFWNFPQAEQQAQMINFMKNVALIGAMLFVTSVGAGPCSFDNGWRKLGERRDVVEPENTRA